MTKTTLTDAAGRPSCPPPCAGSPAAAHRHLGLALVVICLAQLMVVLDATIVNVALPSIQQALRFSPANLIWVVNAYTLAFGGLLLLGGRTGDLFGRRRMFVVGVTVFTVASLLAGLARGEGWLIGARVLQGVGAAIAAPTALALIASTFPEGQPRNRAMGVYAAISGAGAAAGLLLGGALTSTLGWQWVFFVNVPVGLAVVVATPLVVAESTGSRGRLDLPGAAASTLGMTLLVYGLIHAATTSWTDRWTIVALTTGAVLLGVFVAFEVRSPSALMPIRIFSSRDRSATYVINLAVGTAVFSMFFFATLFMQDILGFGPLKSGLCYLPAALTIALVAGVVSRVVVRIGTKLLLSIGTALAAGGLLWFSHVTPSSSYWGGLFGPLMCTAVGMGVCFVPLTVNAVAGVEPDEQGIAAALLNTGQQLGGTIGLAVLGTIAVQVTRAQIADVVHRLGPSAAAATRSLSSSSPPSARTTSPVLHHAVDSAFVSGYTTAFAVGAGVLAVAFALSLVALRRKAPEGATAPALPIAALEAAQP